MSPRTKVQSEQAVSPASEDDHLLAVEAAAVFVAEAVNEMLSRQAELGRRVVAAREAGISLRKIARVSGLSHTTIAAIGRQGQALIEYVLIIALICLIAITAIRFL